MACVKYSTTPTSSDSLGSLLRNTDGGGWTLQAPTPSRPRTPARFALANAVRSLANERWTTIPTLERTSWRDPFGPAGWCRTGGVFLRRNGFTGFLNAHTAELFYGPGYQASSPYNMPNASDPPSVQSILWDSDLVSWNQTVHWYTVPGPESVLQVYQINPEHVGKHKATRFTRRILSFTGWSYPDTWYELSAPMAWHVDEGQYLALWTRFRSTGGFSMSSLVTILR